MNEEDYNPDEDFISKTQIKNDAQEMKSLGLEVAALPQAHFDALPMGDALRDAIADYRRITHKNALKRQASYVGKMVRKDDPEALRVGLQALTENKHRKAQQLKHTEQWCQNLIEKEEQTLKLFLDHAPHTDRQQLRTLIRNTKKEKANMEAVGKPFSQKKSTAMKRLFKFIQEQI